MFWCMYMYTMYKRAHIWVAVSISVLYTCTCTCTCNSMYIHIHMFWCMHTYTCTCTQCINVHAHTWMACMKLMNVRGQTLKWQERPLVLKMLYATHTREFPAEISSNLNTSGLHHSTSVIMNCTVYNVQIHQ